MIIAKDMSGSGTTISTSSPLAGTATAQTDRSSQPVYCCFAVAYDVPPCVAPYVLYLYCCLCLLPCGHAAYGWCPLHCACHAHLPLHSWTPGLCLCCGSECVPHHEGAICHCGRWADWVALAPLSSGGGGSCLRWRAGCCLLEGMKGRGTGRMLSPLQERAGPTAHTMDKTQQGNDL